MLSTPLRRTRSRRRRHRARLPCLLAGPAAAAGPRGPSADPQLTFRGESTLPAGATFDGTVVGGLSSIAYDPPPRRLLRAVRRPGRRLHPDQHAARFYTLDIDVSDGTLDPGDVTVLAVTTLRGPDGQPFPPLSLDPEGLTLTREDRLIITSEGIATQGIAPFVREFDLSGQQVAELPVPGYFDPVDSTHGVRQNLGFEAAAVAPHGQPLFVGAENALAQDGPAATTTTGSNGPAAALPPRRRSSTVRSRSGCTRPRRSSRVAGVHRERAGRAAAVGQRAPAGDGAVLLGRCGQHDPHLPGRRCTGATNVAGIDDLDKVKKLRTVRKTLLLDLDELGLTLDNIEGMTLGPRLPDGRQSLAARQRQQLHPRSGEPVPDVRAPLSRRTPAAA